jgi:hypothetical protein
LVLGAALWGLAGQGPTTAPRDAPDAFWGRPAWSDDGVLAEPPAHSPVPGRAVAQRAPGPDLNAALDRWGPRFGATAAVSRRYLRAVEFAESGVSARAHAATSSAAGSYQFIDQTWLRILRTYGPGLGLGREAALVRLDADGRARVADPNLKSALLALRYDPELSRLLAAALSVENAGRLRAALARPPTAAELYAAHLFGPAGALALLSAARAAPALPACKVLPAAAVTNRPLFYTADGPRSARALFSLIAARADRS